MFEARREFLLQAGQDSWAAEQLGTLLAAANVVMADRKRLPEEIDRVVGQLGAGRLAETRHSKPNWERCVE